jgi:beta-glucosidase
MSVEWARIEPEPGQWDQEALDRYRRMIGALRDASVEPMVTLHHFTLPRWVAREGGLLNPDYSVRFERFVSRVLESLGDLVVRWVTINEPNVLAAMGYLMGVFPPAKRNPRQAIRAHEALIEAHGRAYRAIHSLAGRRGWDAQVGVAHHLRIVEPCRPRHPGDRVGAHVLDEAFNQAFLRALCGGVVPMGERALIALSGAHRVDVRGTQDFLGINYYGRDRARLSATAKEFFVRREVPRGAEVSDLGWEVHPEGLGELLRTWGRATKLPIYVTENGIADSRDAQRSSFLVRHLAQIADVIREGIDVRGYFHWSLLDNFEWAEGYGPRFGLYEVDYTTQSRRARPSAEVFRRIATSHRIDASMWADHGGEPEMAWRHG